MRNKFCKRRKMALFKDFFAFMQEWYFKYISFIRLDSYYARKLTKNK
jgi:hypothetical protein